MIKPLVSLPFWLAVSPFSLAYTALPNEGKMNNQAYILMDYESGRVLTGDHINSRLPPASLTKLMTSFLVEQQLLRGNIGEHDLVPFKAAWQCRTARSESCSYLAPGQKYQVLDLLRGVIIQSGNDSALTLANYLSGSEGAFVQKMNRQAALLGMKNTRFANVTGLDQKNHYSSVYDMALLSRAIISGNRRYYPLYSEKSYRINRISQNNRNALLYIDPGVDGLKTGHTAGAGYSLSASIRRANLRLIAVILGAPGAGARAQQGRDLFKWGFENYEASLLKKAGQTVGRAPVKNALVKDLPVALQNNLYVTTPKNQPLPALNSELRLVSGLTAPVKKGTVLGTLVTYDHNHQLLASEPVVAAVSVEKAEWHQRLRNRFGF